MAKFAATVRHLVDDHNVHPDLADALGPRDRRWLHDDLHGPDRAVDHTHEEHDT